MAQVSQRDVNSKREDNIEWNQYFMGMAILAAKRSVDPRFKVGAVIVNKKNQIVGIGCTNFPERCEKNFNVTTNNDKSSENYEELYICHAEINAILNKNVPDLDECSIYVGLFPCNECVKCIIQSGIKKIFYLSDNNTNKEAHEAAKKMLDAVKVEYELFYPKKKTFDIDFEEIEWNNPEKVDPK